MTLLDFCLKTQPGSSVVKRRLWCRRHFLLVGTRGSVESTRQGEKVLDAMGEQVRTVERLYKGSRTTRHSHETRFC